VLPDMSVCVMPPRLRATKGDMKATPPRVVGVNSLTPSDGRPRADSNPLIFREHEQLPDSYERASSDKESLNARSQCGPVDATHDQNFVMSFPFGGFNCGQLRSRPTGIKLLAG
jgi:hypothetical protein